MNKKLVLALLSSPSVLSSLFLAINSVKAAEVQPQFGTITGSSSAVRRGCSYTRCVSSTQLALLKGAPLRKRIFQKPSQVAYTQTDAEYPMTEEESNSSIALFGCDSRQTPLVNKSNFFSIIPKLIALTISY